MLSRFLAWLDRLFYNLETEAEVLRLLDESGRPMHGREVLKASKVKVSEGTLYPMLRAMEQQRFLLCREVHTPRTDRDRGGRARFYYDLTDLGRERLAELRAAKNT